MKFLILNGPNINLARWSEPGVPGEVDYTGLMDYVQAGCDQLGIETDICQSNHEGDLIDEIQSAPGRVDGIVLNPARRTWCPLAVRDILSAKARRATCTPASGWRSCCAPTAPVRHIS